MSGQDAIKSKHTAAQKEDITAAGIVIYGTNPEGKRAFVMPYTEGRFGFGDKYYVLPKGKIDDGETPIQTAIRETEEETGISLENLLGREAKEQLAAGKEQKESIDSPGYPGVRVVRVGLDPVIHTSISQSHKGRTMALYGIEVEGIENLASHLKNPKNAATQDFKVTHSITEMVQDSSKYPQLTDFLSWMRSGEVPDADWSRDKKILEPLSPEDSKNFRRIEAAFMKNKKTKIITTR